MAAVARRVVPQWGTLPLHTLRRAWLSTTTSAKTDQGSAAATAKGGKGKDGDTIGSFFASLGAEAQYEPRLADLKREIAPSKDIVQAAWQRVADQLAFGTERVVADPAGAVCEVRFEDIARNNGRLPDKHERRARETGVVVIRGVVQPAEALKWKAEVKEYIQANKEKVVGFPADQPQVYELYWSQAQVQARQHRNVLAAGVALNLLWKGNAIDPSTPVTYVDRLRIRQPGDSQFALGPHIDGGSLERWEDPQYRRVYDALLHGQVDKYDPFAADARSSVRMDLYNAANACTVFRTFQGWLSLSECGPGQGTLHTLPLLREATAFVLLRPFLDDVPEHVFCGAFAGKGQDIGAQWHKPLLDAVVPVPPVVPGDMVFWHCDTIHAVDPHHGGTQDASVFFIPAAPLCAMNATYLARQREAFLAGVSPPDFPKGSEAAFPQRATRDLLTPEGARAMGMEPFRPGSVQRPQLHKQCNSILGFK